MTKYKDAEPLSVLPFILAADPDIVSISYAYKRAMLKLVEISAKTMLYADIDSMDEELLNLMALEFNTQYYDESLPIETKRKLVKNSLNWHQRAGTTGAVNELIDIALGDGEVVEWFNFDGAPGTFKIVTSEKMNDSSLNFFQNIISKVKNMSSKLVSIEQSSKISMNLYVGINFVQAVNTVIR